MLAFRDTFVMKEYKIVMIGLEKLKREHRTRTEDHSSQRMVREIAKMVLDLEEKLLSHLYRCSTDQWSHEGGAWSEYDELKNATADGRDVVRRGQLAMDGGLDEHDDMMDLLH